MCRLSASCCFFVTGYYCERLAVLTCMALLQIIWPTWVRLWSDMQALRVLAVMHSKAVDVACVEGDRLL